MPRVVDYTVQSLERRLLLAAGDLDVNFGTNGLVAGAGAPVAKLLVGSGGVFSLTRTDNTPASDVAVVKVLANGQPDVSFGVNGQATIGLATQQDDPIDFAATSGGQIIVLASRFDPQISLSEQYMVRLNPDGTRDATFNATGEVVVSNNSAISYASVTTDAPGSIYVGGGGPGAFLISKYVPGGSADPTFGSGGTLTITGTTGSQITQLLIGGGNVIAVGSDFSNTSVFSRNSADGAANGGFGSGGVATISAASPVADARLDSQGRIVVMAFEAAGAALTRFTAAGILDGSFGVGGNVTLGATQFEAMDIGPGDNISVAGTAGSSLIIRRLLGGSGAIDPAYGTSGEATATLPAAVALPGVSSIVVLADGSALVGGGDFETQDSFYVTRFLGDTPNFAVLDSRTGTLTVTGTASADQVVIDVQGGVTLVVRLVPDQLQFPVSAVLALNISTGDGADQVTLTPAVVIGAVIATGANPSTVFGGSGNDTITGGGGFDRIDGGAGNDLIAGYGAADTLRGGAGNDTLDAGSGDDFADGSDGDDVLVGGDGADTLQPGAGADAVDAGAGNDFVGGFDGPKLIMGGGGNDTLAGGNGNDTISGGSGNDQIFANGGDDSIIGGAGHDDLNGGDGNDRIEAGAGNDLVQGGLGTDLINGAEGSDSLVGNEGNDSIAGGDDADFIDAGPGADAADGGSGDDSIIGAGGNDSLLGGLGNDELSGSAGNDTLDAGAGNDRVFGGDDNDTLMGGAGFDTLDGQMGGDFVSGGDGNDLLISDDGTIDQLNGDQGLDIARGDLDEAYTLVEYRYRFLG